MQTDEINEKSLYEAIFKRKSIRKYSDKEFDAEFLKEVIRIAENTRPLIPESEAGFQILGKDEIKGIVSAKAPYFLAAYAKKDKNSIVNAAFRLQQMDLWFSEKGIGTCWLGMPSPKDGALKLGDLDFIIVLAFGTTGENVHRQNASEFKRKALEEITDITGNEDLLEPIRLAPSASNRQPWLFTAEKNTLRVFLKKAGAVQRAMLGIMPYVDMGIVLCHAWLSFSQGGIFDSFNYEVLNFSEPNGYEYLYSISCNREI